jgi:hypothetical protein
MTKELQSTNTSLMSHTIKDQVDEIRKLGMRVMLVLGVVVKETHCEMHSSCFFYRMLDGLKQSSEN